MFFDEFFFPMYFQIKKVSLPQPVSAAGLLPFNFRIGRILSNSSNGEMKSFKMGNLLTKIALVESSIKCLVTYSVMTGNDIRLAGKKSKKIAGSPNRCGFSNHGFKSNFPGRFKNYCINLLCLKVLLNL